MYSYWKHKIKDSIYFDKKNIPSNDNIDDWIEAFPGDFPEWDQKLKESNEWQIIGSNDGLIFMHNDPCDNNIYCIKKGISVNWSMNFEKNDITLTFKSHELQPIYNIGKKVKKELKKSLDLSDIWKKIKNYAKMPDKYWKHPQKRVKIRKNRQKGDWVEISEKEYDILNREEMDKYNAATKRETAYDN